MKSLKRLHRGLFLLVEELSLALHALIQLLRALARNTENPWSCEGGLSSSYQRSNVSTRKHALPTGSLDIRRGPPPWHGHTQARDLRGPAGAPAHTPAPSAKPAQSHTAPYIRPAGAKNTGPSGSRPLPPTAWTSG